MTSTALEKLRQRYQDIEDERKRAMKLLLVPAKTVKEDVYITHHVADHARRVQQMSCDILDTEIPRSTDPLASFYSDLERRMQFHREVADTEVENDAPEEAAEETKTSMNELVFDIKGTAHLSLFYDNERFQEWKRQRKTQKPAARKRKVVVPEDDDALKKFNGEECYGQYLDLTAVHRSIGALGVHEVPGYVDFLQSLEATDFAFVPRNANGEKFLGDLVAYLFSFIERSQPFTDLGELRGRIHRDFRGEDVISPDMVNDCALCGREFESSEDLQHHFTQRSHARNEARAEKCGGVAAFIERRRASRAEFDENKFTAAALIRVLSQRLSATIENCKRRHNLSSAVMQAEQNLDAPLVFDDIDDQEEHFYNPKGLPLGWDGKPIPYWLYKLHGLSVEYKCEICGNRSYWGALAFERHFFDSKHINALKALGIPPTRHFVYVTGVNEAISLFEKIKKTLAREVWQAGDEEIETDDGQVMSLKIYQDLVRQGIIKPGKKE